ncbi:hypothetical protein HELRODRAFT_179030 [Helobdella robusta]|uniref:Uncharacterized protein n=1 Tax=Helobdella robusta TaxID=6412 RepID=T1FE28_HELRO|nr:hypothetical protein HELRODRAFT_179030 [Helobdella robusta]ESN95840.1 hypothetical protein HELRODRAFT_179030 [Helobdella robusta]
MPTGIQQKRYQDRSLQHTICYFMKGRHNVIVWYLLFASQQTIKIENKQSNSNNNNNNNNNIINSINNSKVQGEQFTIIFCKVFPMLFNYLKQKLFLLCVFGDCFIEMLYQRYSPFCRVIDANQILYKHCCNLERRSI